MLKIPILNWLQLFVAALVLTACAAANPISKAETTEQRAYATYGTFVIFQEQALNLVQGGRVSDNVSLRIIRAEERAKPVADSLLEAVMEFERIKAEFEAGATGEDRFVIAANNLNSWIERAAPLINALASAVKGGDT